MQGRFDGATGGGVASVTESERRSTKQVGATKKYAWSIPAGVYAQLVYVQSVEKIVFAQALLKIVRLGLQVWRDQQKTEEPTGDDTP